MVSLFGDDCRSNCPNQVHDDPDSKVSIVGRVPAEEALVPQEADQCGHLGWERLAEEILYLLLPGGVCIEGIVGRLVDDAHNEHKVLASYLCISLPHEQHILPQGQWISHSTLTLNYKPYRWTQQSTIY